MGLSITRRILKIQRQIIEAEKLSQKRIDELVLEIMQQYKGGNNGRHNNEMGMSGVLNEKFKAHYEAPSVSGVTLYFNV